MGVRSPSGSLESETVGRRLLTFFFFLVLRSRGRDSESESGVGVLVGTGSGSREFEWESGVPGGAGSRRQSAVDC